jgi:hypothetical protein
VTALEFLGWVASISVSLIFVSIAVLVMAGVVMQITRPGSRRSVGRRKD